MITTKGWIARLVGLALSLGSVGTAQAVTAATYMGPDCNAATSGIVDRTAFYASAVLNSPVFAQCIDARLRGRSGRWRYKTCPDPDPSRTRNSVDAVVAAIYAGTHLQMSCSYSTANNMAASAHLGTWLQQSNTAMDLADDWLEENYTRWAGQGQKPWNWRASDLVHESLHQQGYQHPDTGTCRGVDSFYNSAPYLVGVCLDNIIDYSPCGSLDACADPDDVRLPGAWDSRRDLPSSNAAQCQCVPSGRRRIALRASNGTNYLSAINAGGGVVDAHALGAGSWEALHMIDLNGGRIANGDKVQIRAGNGNLLRAAAGQLRADATTTQSMRILGGWTGPANDPTVFTVVTTGTMVSGGQIGLKAFDGRFVVSEQGGGGTINANRTTQGIWETFTVDAPRRAWLVRLQSQNGENRYVTYDGTAAAPLRVSSTTESDTGAFWVLDHNGGALQSGDTISFESDEFPGKFVSSCAGTGTVTGSAAYLSACSKFRLDIAGMVAGTQVAPGQTVTLRSAQGTYLTAQTSSAPFPQTIQNYGLTIAAPQRFTLRKVGAWNVD